MRFGHSTPLIIQVHNKPQMLLVASGMEKAGDALQSLDPADGKLLWWCRGEGDASSPAYGQGLVYFDGGRGGTGVAVDPNGSGDVSNTHVRWTIMQRGEALSSPIVVGKYLYRLRTPGFLQCWEMATGKEMYSERDRLQISFSSFLQDSDLLLEVLDGFPGHTCIPTTGNSGRDYLPSGRP